MYTRFQYHENLTGNLSSYVCTYYTILLGCFVILNFLILVVFVHRFPWNNTRATY